MTELIALWALSLVVAAAIGVVIGMEFGLRRMIRQMGRREFLPVYRHVAQQAEQRALEHESLRDRTVATVAPSSRPSRVSKARMRGRRMQ